MTTLKVWGFSGFGVFLRPLSVVVLVLIAGVGCHSQSSSQSSPPVRSGTLSSPLPSPSASALPYARPSAIPSPISIPLGLTPATPVVPSSVPRGALPLGLDRNAVHQPNGIAQVRDPGDRHLQIINPDRVTHVMNRIQEQHSPLEVRGIPDFTIAATEADAPAEIASGQGLDYLDTYVLGLGIGEFIRSSDAGQPVTLPVLVSHSKLYRPALLCVAQDGVCQDVIADAIAHPIYAPLGTPVRLFTHFSDAAVARFRARLPDGQQFILRFVALGALGPVGGEEISRTQQAFRRILNAPTHPGENESMKQATADSLARYQELARDSGREPSMLDFVQRFRLANCEMTALAAAQVLADPLRVGGVPPLFRDARVQAKIAAGYPVKDSYIDLNAENHAWNIFYSPDFGAISLDLTPAPSKFVESFFAPSTLDWLRGKLAGLNIHRNHMAVPRLSARSIITGVEQSIFDEIDEAGRQVIQEIRNHPGNQEERLIEQALRALGDRFPGGFDHYERVLNVEGFRAPDHFDCAQSLCYRLRGQNIFVRVFIENHLVNYGRLGEMAFYIPNTEGTTYRDFQPQGERWSYPRVLAPEESLQNDGRRMGLFHLMTPALESGITLANSLFIDVDDHVHAEYFSDRFNPVTRLTDQWLSMNWRGDFVGRQLTTEFRETPEFRLLTIQTRDGFDFIPQAADYLARFSIIENPQFRRALAAGNLNAFEGEGFGFNFNGSWFRGGENNNFLTLSGWRYDANLGDSQWDAIQYLRPSALEERIEFFYGRGELGKFYELRVKPVSYIAE